MQKLTPAQKKTVISALIFSVGFILFWFLLYGPSRANLIRTKFELSSVENKLNQIEVMFGQAKSAEEGIKLMDAKYQELSKKFPAKEEEGFTMLSDFAKNAHIEVGSVRMQPKVDFLDANNAKIEIEGKACQVVAVSMEMKCLYKDLVNYLEALRKSSPVFNVVESLRVAKDPAGSLKLNVSLDLSMYLLN